MDMIILNNMNATQWYTIGVISSFAVGYALARITREKRIKKLELGQKFNSHLLNDLRKRIAKIEFDNGK